MSDDVTIGELARRVERIDDRVERMDAGMHTGFDSLRAAIGKLSFVSPEVYDANRAGDTARVGRLESDLREEESARKSAEGRSDDRGWKVRLALGVALLGFCLSAAAAVLSASVAG